MPAVAQTINLTTLNKFMKDYPSGTIVPSQFLWHNLYDDLKARVSSDQFVGNNVEILMETSSPMSFTAFGEGIDLPYGDSLGYVKMQVPLKEVITTAMITKQMMDRATGGLASWGSVIPRIIDARTRDFLYGMELCAIGDGTGRLARSSAAGDHTDSSSDWKVEVTCDNTYTDFGAENVQWIKKGMWVEFYTAAGAKADDNNSVYAWKVTDVTYGDRNNGAATTGTFKVATASDAAAQHLAAHIDDGTTVFLAGTMSNASSTTDDVGATRRYEITNGMGSVEIYCSLPMGLTGIIQSTNTSYDYNDGSIDYTLDTFQGLTRSTYSTLSAKMYNGVDLGGTAGTPQDWTLSAITSALADVMDEGGQTDVLLCSSQMAIAIANQNATEGAFALTVTSTGQFDQPAAGTRYARAFLAPDGKQIPIRITRSMPRNCIYGLCLEDLKWYTKGSFGPLNLTGQGEWMFGPDQRKTVFEAPYGGYSQLAAIRCDRHFSIQDLKDNV